MLKNVAEIDTFEGMKLLSADYIFPGHEAPIKNGVIEVGLNGEILAVLNPMKDHINWGNVEKYTGIICPGFINTHCHLELSYLKGEIGEKKKLTGFIKEIVEKRDQYTIEEKQEAIVLAEAEMITNGIVAVGDISNDSTTFDQKRKNNLHYHSFIEVFGTNTSVANQAIESALALKQEHPNKHASIVPHAPYSMSPTLIQKVADLNEKIISIHNQETAEENEMFERGSGKLLEIMQSFAPEMNDYQASGKSSLQSYLPHYYNAERMLLVHNTFTRKEDIRFTKSAPIAIYWCFCPNANEYIEGTQPNYQLFLNEKCTIGTDSYASNWSLSVLDELKTITRKDKSISLDILLKWATYNGAQFLGIDHLGSIEEGKIPGLNLIENVDLVNFCLTEKSSVIPIL